MSRFFWKHQSDPTPRPEHYERPRGVEMLYERGCKTFDAAAVGGPVHGRLCRAPIDVEWWMAPTASGGAERYRLHIQPDGVRIWLHEQQNLA